MTAGKKYREKYLEDYKKRMAFIPGIILKKGTC